MGDNAKNKKNSLDGLSPEEALKGFMETDPEKVRAAEKREKDEKARRKKKPTPKK